MKEYKFLKGALTICPVEFGFSEVEYKERFKSFLKESGPSYIENIKNEFLEALNDPEWSWKKAAEDTRYFAYDQNDTEEEAFKNIKWLMADILFPETL